MFTNRKFTIVGAIAGALLVTIGVFAANDWFPKTDAFTGKKTGWFGKDLPKNATSAWNPIPPPSPTPQLSKEYIYAGQRLLAVEDVNAASAPPADIAVWRPSNGNWMVMGQTGSATVTQQFGGSGDKPIPQDYDGDGKTDFALFREMSPYAVFFIWPASAGGWSSNQWGLPGDIPVPADYDGDGLADIAIARPDPGQGNLLWAASRSSDQSTGIWTWGADTDIPCPADYNGDGIADLGVYRPTDGTFWTYNTLNGEYHMTNIGTVTNNKCVSSDYDGDGKADIAIYDSSNANWTIHRSTDGNLSTVTWGSAGNIPVQNDYDGDGKTDLAVWNNAASAQWSIKRSTNGTTRTETFGTTGDIPVPAWYRR